MLHQHLAVRILLQPVEQDRANLVLLQHQPVWVGRIVGERAEIEIGDHAGAAVAILIVAYDVAAREHGIGDAACGEQFQRRRVDGAGARIVEDLVAGFQHRYRNAAPGEVERRRQPDRPGAGDQHALR